MAQCLIVKLLHCGSEEELSFIQHVHNAINSTRAQHVLRLEDAHYHKENQTKDALMVKDLQKLRKEKAPLIVLISRAFFDMVWVTASKPTIVSAVSSYTSRNCLHVWLNLSERDVQQRSKALLRPDNYFRKVPSEELMNLSPENLIKRIYELVKGIGVAKPNIPNNYSVDNEINEMEQRFNAINMNNNNGSRRSSSSSSSRDNTLSGKRKYDDNRMTRSQKLSDMSENDTEQIALALSKGPGANWKQLAEAFEIDANTITMLSTQNQQELARSKQFLDVLKQTKPDVDISVFLTKCKQIIRSDVARYIEDTIMR